jgi:uncharacterized damage-inducible protein DinB
VDLLEHIRRQFAYDAWANREVLVALKDSLQEPPSQRPVQLLAHIFSAERLWLERLREQPQSLPVWPAGTLDECEAQIAELREMWRVYFAALTAPALTHTITYKNTKGEAWSNTAIDVLTHVVLHSAYHRGQIASLMRTGGATPAYTDFIHSVRQGFIE